MEDQEVKAKDSPAEGLPPVVPANTKQKKKNKKEKQPGNPYANTEIIAINILKKQTREAKKKSLAKIQRPATVTTPILKDIEEEDNMGEKQDRLSQMGREQDATEGRESRQSMFPPVEQGKGLTSTRSRSESRRSLYVNEEDKKNKKGKASGVTRATTLGLITEVGGGSLYTYTGVQKLRKEYIKQNADRLSHCLPDNVPDAKRVASSSVVDKCGLTASFQWTAGGKRCHGFIW